MYSDNLIERMKEKLTRHSLELHVNGNRITTVLVGRHYLSKHGSYMNDALIWI